MSELMKKTLSTEQLATMDWSWTSDDDGRWGPNEIQNALVAYVAQQAKIQTARLRNIDNSISAINHYFHRLDDDGFRELIRIKAMDARRRANKKIINAVACTLCSRGRHVACVSSSGHLRKPHNARIRAYEAS